MASLPPAVALAQTDGANGYPTFTLSQLRTDFDLLHELIRSRHPLIYSNRPELDAAFATERGKLRDGMSELELFRVLSSLVRQVNCGHTSLALSDATERRTSPMRRYVPLVIQSIRGKLHVTAAPADQLDLRGHEVLGINGRSSPEIIQQLYDAIPADGLNLTRKVTFINRGFAAYYHLHVDTASTFTVELLAPGAAEPTTVTLAGIDPASWDALRPPDDRADVDIVSTSFTDTHAFMWVRTFNLYDSGGMQRFRTLMDQFFAELALRQSPNLILDLRGNGGGEPRLGAYLLSYLISKPTLYFTDDAGYYPTLRTPTQPAANAYTGPLYVLVDGDVFSTNGHVVSLLKYHGIGLLIGEETGGSFSCTANNASTTLTHSRLRLNYARSTFTTAVQGLPAARGVFPDETVVAAVDDVLAGRDVTMDQALAHIRAEMEPPVITAQPVAQVVMSEAPVSLVVQADGAELSYQWRHDGIPLTGAGADTPMYVIETFTETDEGDYDVVISNAAGSVTSVPVRLSPGTGAGSRLVNLSSRGRLSAAGDVLIAGFAITGDDERTVLIRGLGPALGALDIVDPLKEPHLILFSGSEPIASNNGWQTADAERIRAASARVGAFPLPEDGRDCVLLATLRPGNYTAHLGTRSPDGGTGLIEVYDASADGGRTLVNLSTLARLPGSSSPLISGLVIAGDSPQTVLLRAIGPGLAAHHVNGSLSLPRMALYAGSAVVRPGHSIGASADPEKFIAASASVGAFELEPESADHVLLTTLQPGAYTIVAGSDAPGWILTEVYAVPLASK